MKKCAQILMFRATDTHFQLRLQDAAARGKPLEDIPLHSCTCPPCFTEYMNNGKMECVPKCDLATCDAATGICSGGFGGSGGELSPSKPSCLPEVLSACQRVLVTSSVAACLSCGFLVRQMLEEQRYCRLCGMLFLSLACHLLGCLCASLSGGLCGPSPPPSRTEAAVESRGHAVGVPRLALICHLRKFGTFVSLPKAAEDGCRR